jgi:putative PEP-CTERM system histidine kinase
MHDLKGLAAQLSMVVGNADRHRRNPEFVDDAISTIAHSTARMQRLIEQLQGQQLQANLRRTSVSAVVHDACRRCSHRAPVPTLCVDRDDAFVLADPERLGTMVEHLIRNAQDATAEAGEITISVRSERDAERNVALVSVSDTGVGMTPQFVRERLFQPFDSTKGAAGMGIGAYEVRQYVQGLGGSVEVLREPGAGTSVILRLPACA